MEILSEQIKTTLREAARKLSGDKRRTFIAQVALDYFDGSARKTETYMGWGRVSLQRGLDTLASGVPYQDRYQERGRKRSEERLPTLADDIRELVDGHSQVDPKFQTQFRYARVSARAVRAALIEQKGYAVAQLPTRETIGNVLNRLGYRLKKP